MSKKRLMLITHDLATGGLQQVIVNICRTLDRNYFDVSVLCLRELGRLTPEIEKLGIKVFRIPQKEDGVDYLSFLKVAKILRQQKAEVIHTHNTQPFIDGVIGGLLAGVKTIVHTDHARDFPDKKRYMFAEWLMSHFVYRVVGVSEHTSRNLIHYEKISKGKIVTIYNGIEGSKYDIAIDKATKKSELGIKNKGPIIGVGVRLSQQKGVSYLLQAMPELIRTLPDMTLVIAGEGPLEEDLKNEAASLGISNHVIFLGPRLDMPELLKLFDLYVLPSLWEGLPMVLLEAMASGCPIVATAVGGNASAVRDGFNGSLVKPRDAKALSDEIIRVLSSADILKKYSVNGIDTFREKFEARVMTKRYEQLYKREYRQV
jgi:glycosyltransferase involved in cell wall biosynthesis